MFCSNHIKYASFFASLVRISFNFVLNFRVPELIRRSMYYVGSSSGLRARFCVHNSGKRMVGTEC